MTKKLVALILISIIFALLMIYFIVGYYKKEDGDLKIYFFNAGKADSAIITIEDTVILIDTGEYNLRNIIKGYLEGHNITTIDYLIITHFDKDHVGSASDIIDNYNVLNVYQSNVFKDSEYYSYYINSLKEKEIDAVTVSGDLELSFDNFNMIINGPDKIYDKNESNNSSLITKINYQNTSYLFMGDCENDRIVDYLDNHKDKVDVLKLPYHGNYQKKDKDLLEVVSPKYVIVSTNETIYDEKLVNLLEEGNYNYYVTKDGAITLTSNGENINIRQ